LLGYGERNYDVQIKLMGKNTRERRGGNKDRKAMEERNIAGEVCFNVIARAEEGR
jgi:hypothetical protein